MVRRKQPDGERIVIIKPTDLAAGQLTAGEINYVVSQAIAQAEARPGWRPGQTFRLNFTKDGSGFTVAVTFRQKSYRALVGVSDGLSRDH